MCTTYLIFSNAIHQIMTKPNRSVTLNLTGNFGAGVNRRLGTLLVQAEETIASKTVVEMNFRCINLDNKDLFSKSVRANLCILVLFSNDIKILFISSKFSFYFLF